MTGWALISLSLSAQWTTLAAVFVTARYSSGAESSHSQESTRTTPTTSSFSLVRNSSTSHTPRAAGRIPLHRVTTDDDATESAGAAGAPAAVRRHRVGSPLG